MTNCRATLAARTTMDAVLGGQRVPLPDVLAALEAMPSGIAVVSGQGVLAANRAFLSQLRCDRPEEAAGLVAAALGVADPPPQGLAAALSRACPQGSASCDIRTADGPVRLDVVHTAEEGWSLTACSRLEQVRMQSQANRAQKVALVALADLAEYRDCDTGEHVLRVARMTHEIARTLKERGRYLDELDDDFLHNIGLASILHDVGKVGVPDSVLLKPARLNAEERVVMERHAHTGGTILAKAERMLVGSRRFKLASEIAGGHHECWDGTGYPNRLRAEEIPLAARIVAVADVYDALTSKRPYKEPWPQEEAVAFVTGRSGSQFDPLVVAAFLDVLAMRARAAVVEWSESIAIGEPMVDHDHRILLALINQIASPENRNDAAAVEFVLDELVNYTNFHFQREEELMAAAGYPGLEEHRAIHRRLVAEVTELQQRFSDAGGSAAMGEDLSRYLVGWLTRHVMEEDKKYQSCVAKYRREQGGKG